METSNHHCRIIRSVKVQDIERQIPKLTPRISSKELKSLEEHQLIKRSVYDTVPVTIEYKLTSPAKTLHTLAAHVKPNPVC